MRQFTGTKTLLAQPMTRGAYNDYRGWVTPADENPDEEGYLVEYTDGGKPNDARHKGYISWSPADVFEAAYKPSGSHVDRLRNELAELEDRLTKLHSFIMGNPAFTTLNGVDKELLIVQAQMTEALKALLEMRLNRAFA